MLRLKQGTSLLLQFTVKCILVFNPIKTKTKRYLDVPFPKAPPFENAQNKAGLLPTF